MMMRGWIGMKRTIAVMACVGMLSGCVTDGTMTKEQVGTGTGAVVGGIVGAFFGQGSGRVVATLAGAAIGGFIGNRIGAQLDEQDRQALQSQARQALLTRPDNAPVTWSSPRSGATATIVPQNTRHETRKVRVVRDAAVDPAPKLELIGAKYKATGNANVRLEHFLIIRDRIQWR